MTRRALVAIAARIIDIGLLPFVALLAPFSRLFRFAGPQRLPATRWLYRALGIWPLRRHYYDPLFDPRDLSGPLDVVRALPGIDWNVTHQLRILQSMRYAGELAAFLVADSSDPSRFSFENSSFVSGDADYLYSFVRAFKPRRIVEVGCGHTTRLIAAARGRNREDDPAYRCAHTCVEPYESPWLESLGVSVLRERVERLPMDTFTGLESGDLLFIDSSHVIRPCGDVLFQIMEILPVLKSGVFVHFHDIFSPRHYLREWLDKNVFLWNEQYLLEAFLCNNAWYRIVGALNFLHHAHFEPLAAICAQHRPHFEPGSFYIQRL
jgi:hypothetical protein